MMAVAACSGAMVMAMAAPAFADSVAGGAAAGSPGLISGNTVQLPAQVPVNVCGNTVNVVGLLNPAVGNRCAGEGRGLSAEAPGGTSADAGGGASADGGGQDAPGVLSGNGVQLPVRLPVNVSGNSVNVVGVGDAAVGNESAHTPQDRPTVPDGHDRPGPPVKRAPEPTPPPAATTPAPRPAEPGHFTGTLARTGADGTVPALVGGAALVLGGAAVYRRFRPPAACPPAGSARRDAGR
jgi:LPXTG-motif cell wall-anchored protein